MEMSSNSIDTDMEMAQQNLPANASSEARNPNQGDAKPAEHEGFLKAALQVSTTTTTITFAGTMCLTSGYLKSLIGPSRWLRILLTSTMFSGFLSGISLMLLTLMLLMLNRHTIRPCHILSVRILSFSSLALLTLFLALSFYVLLLKEYAVIVFLLPLAIAIVGFPIVDPVEPSDDESKENELKSSSRLSILVTSLTFGAMMTIFPAFLNKPGEIIETLSLSLRACAFLVLSSLLNGLTLMFFTTVLLMRNNYSIISQFYFRLVRVLTVSSLISLALVALHICVLLLNAFALLAFVPTLIGAAAISLIMGSCFKIPLRPPSRNDLEHAATIFSLVLTVSFGGIMSLFTIYLWNPLGHALTFHLESIIFILLSAFISGLSSMLLTFTSRNSAEVVRILAHSALGVLILAALYVFTILYQGLKIKS